MGQLGHRTLQGRDREVNPRRVVSLEGQHVRQIACGQVRFQAQFLPFENASLLESFCEVRFG